MTNMADFPRPEYPRPQFVRDQWLNLNGWWEFAYDPGKSGATRGLTGEAAYPERILVPFCPESELSGIGNTDFMPCVWYRRNFTVPGDWAGQRVLLHFGAVDYEATVWVNGAKVGSHRGGYTPFSFDITEQLRAGENVVCVRAVDDTRSPLQPSGKQSQQYASYACLYTRTTGIWQTVWLEAAPETRIEKLRLRGSPTRGSLLVEAAVTGRSQETWLQVIASLEGEIVGELAVPAAAHTCVEVPLAQVEPWSPGAPTLYDLRLTLRDEQGRTVDEVGSYCGLREIEVADDRLLLNGEPLFMRLVLDQGFYPEGIYTAPRDEDLRGDVERGLAMGFNGARLHQKVFEPRFLYWADKLGYLVWGEYADWGLDVSRPEALAAMLPEWLEAVERDRNHPALIGWCPFNETPAQRDPEVLRTVYRVTKALDPTRPVIDTSGYHHVETDLYDSHNYEQDPEKFAAAFAEFREGGAPPHGEPGKEADYAGQPYFVSEYGGIWWNPGQTDEQAWGYGNRPQSQEEFFARYRALTETLLSNSRMCGFCYTQLYDVEQEVNGLYTYVREEKFSPDPIADINRQQAASE